MTDLLIKIYNKTPKSIRNTLGKLSVLKRWRDSVLRNEGGYKEAEVAIQHSYGAYQVSFKFVASIKVAASAKQKGIETTLLRHSIALLNRYKLPQDAATVIDIGANFGYLSLVWAQTVSRKGHVLAFEPNARVFKSFEKSIQLNDLKSIVHPEFKAVGNRNEMIPLFLNNTTSNVLKKETDFAAEMVEMIRIDDYLKAHPIDRCDLIKIDVDGIEFDILKGCIASIQKFQPILIVETNNDSRLLPFFYDLGYRILDMDLELYDTRKPLPINIFCIPSCHELSV